MPISAVWLKLNPNEDRKQAGDYNLVIQADFDEYDTNLIEPILNKRSLEMKKENNVWVIFTKGTK